MTKVEVRYRFTRQFEDAWLGAIERLHGVYGMQAVRLDPGMEGVRVTYDATRLKLEDVERQLRTAGLAVERVGGC